MPTANFYDMDDFELLDNVKIWIDENTWHLSQGNQQIMNKSKDEANMFFRNYDGSSNGKKPKMFKQKSQNFFEAT